tara:strand:+ start:536 stop:688 length:153 start_codon:yes stop_codon:yes gene_type:complete
MTSRSKLVKKSDILPWIRFYRKLLNNGKISIGGAAHKRLRHLQERYMGML